MEFLSFERFVLYLPSGRYARPGFLSFNDPIKSALKKVKSKVGPFTDKRWTMFCSLSSD